MTAEDREALPRADDRERELERSLEAADAALERSSRLRDEALGLIGTFLEMHEKNHYREKLRTIFRGGIHA